MNGIHDLGGMEGFGPINAPASEPVFHAPWEGSVFAEVIACMAQGVFTIDELRHAIERMGNAHYIEGSYYEHWLVGMEMLLTEKGLIEPEQVRQLSAKIQHDGKVPEPHAPAGDDPLAAALKQGIAGGLTSEREVAVKPRFSVGDSVRTKNLHPRGHTRVPAYARGKRGHIRAHYGAHVLPDSNAHGQGESPEHLYSIRFEADELWGKDSGRGAGASYLDVWEHYLDKDE